MVFQSLIPVIGSAIAIAGLIGTIIVRDRYIIKLITEGDTDSREKARKGDEGIYKKLDAFSRNCTRDMNEMRDSSQCHYVGKEHFESSISSIQKSLDQFNSNVVNLNQRIDELLKRDF